MELTIGVAALVLLAAGLHATWNSFIKVSGDSLITTTVIMTTGSGLCALALPWIPPPARESWPYLAASIAIHNVYFLLLLRAYRFADFSQAYPIARGTSPLIVALLSGAIVGESLSWGQLGGAGLVALGIGSLAGVGIDRSQVDPRGVGYALACGLSIGAFALVDAVGVRKSEEVFSFIHPLAHRARVYPDPLLHAGAAVGAHPKQRRRGRRSRCVGRCARLRCVRDDPLGVREWARRTGRGAA